MKKIILIIFYLILQIDYLYSQEKVTISGYAKDQESKEVLLFINVSIDEIQTTVNTNEYGFFSITVPIKENYKLKFSSTEFPPFEIKIYANKNINQDFLIKTKSISEIQEVVIKVKKSQGEELIKNTEVSVLRLDTKQAKILPSIGGETDVIKVAQLLPGINKGSEGGTNFFVRGGDGDQNLILIDEATVYNPGHLFGFFSVFNPDVIKDMTIYKGGFPAGYSGRLSSITDIRTNDGDKRKTKVNIGVGMLSSRINIEGPIWKDKISYMLAGRRSYIDKVFKVTGQDIPFYFYDLNGKINYNISKNNKLFISSYYGNDVLDFASKTNDTINTFGFGYKLGNFTQTIRWNHIFNSKLFSNVSLVHTQFKYNIDGKFGSNNILVKSAVEDYGAKYDFQYYHNPEKKINYGLHFTNHLFRPNVVSTSGEISDYLKNKNGALLSTYETNAYLELKKTFSIRWKGDFGFSLPQSFVKNKTYTGLSPRFNLAYQLSDKQAIKLSGSRMYQFMHRVSSSSVALPTDLWYPISENIKPQIADQIAIAYNQNIPKLKSYIIIEGYYKYMQNLTEYREGSQLIMNDDFEHTLVQGNGWSYGAEFLLKKDEGKITGWLGYTLSWTQRIFDELNSGKAFWAKYDRRNYFTAVGIYNLNDRFSFSAIFEICTGARFTPIIGQYLQPNASLTGVESIPIFAERNSYKMSTSHRLDVNIVIKSKINPDKKYYSEWTFGAYNVYNRATPYQIKIVQNEDGTYKYTQPGLFGFIPSIGFNLKF